MKINTNFIQCRPCTGTGTASKQHIGQQTGAQGGGEHSRDVVIDVILSGLRRLVDKLLERFDYFIDPEGGGQAEGEHQNIGHNPHPHPVGVTRRLREERRSERKRRALSLIQNLLKLKPTPSCGKMFRQLH